MPPPFETHFLQGSLGSIRSVSAWEGENIPAAFPETPHRTEADTPPQSRSATERKALYARPFWGEFPKIPKEVRERIPHITAGQ